MTAKRKNISVEKMLGNLTPEQKKQFQNAFNGGMGMGNPPAKKKPAAPKKK